MEAERICRGVWSAARPIHSSVQLARLSPLWHPPPPHSAAPWAVMASAHTRLPPSRGSARRGRGRSSRDGQGKTSQCLGVKLIGSAVGRGHPPPPHPGDLLLRTQPRGGAHRQRGQLRAVAPRGFPHAGRRRGGIHGGTTSRFWCIAASVCYTCLKCS